MAKRFEPGDVVQMIGDDHTRMTISQIIYSQIPFGEIVAETIRCVWFDADNNLHRDEFPVEVIRHA